MPSGFCNITHPGAPNARRRARARLFAALIVSALLHGLLTGSLVADKGGRKSRATASSSNPLEVNLAPLRVDAPTAEPLKDDEVFAVVARAAPPPARSPTQSAARRAAIPSPREEARGERGAQPPASQMSGAAPDPTYYGARQLDVYPVLLTALELRFPAHAAAATGRVLLLVMIDHEGRVDEVSVVEAEPPGVFDEDARRALLDARFKPALKAGRHVKSRLLVQVSYGEESAAR